MRMVCTMPNVFRRRPDSKEVLDLLATRQSKSAAPTRLSFRNAAIALHDDTAADFYRYLSLDSVQREQTHITPHRWVKPGKRVAALDEDLTIKRVFDIRDARSDRVGAMVLSLTDHIDGTRSVLATVEALRLNGLHESLITYIEQRARAAQADVIRVNATSAATRLAMIEAGYRAQDHAKLVANLVQQVGVHVGHAMDLDRRFEFDATSAIGIWREGCDWVARQINMLLPEVSDGRCGSVQFNERTGRVELMDHLEFPGSTLAALRRLNLMDLRGVRIGGSATGLAFPLVFDAGCDSAWNHVVACVPFTAERELAIDLRDTSAAGLPLQVPTDASPDAS